MTRNIFFQPLSSFLHSIVLHVSHNGLKAFVIKIHGLHGKVGMVSKSILIQSVQE